MGKKIPLRQCVGCREMKTKKEMIRVIKTPENEVVLDAKGKQNGRGAYLCFSAECLQKARRSGELLGMMHIVFFSPEDLSIIKEGPAGRRRFLDMELSQRSRPYVLLW